MDEPVAKGHGGHGRRPALEHFATGAAPPRCQQRGSEEACEQRRPDHARVRQQAELEAVGVERLFAAPSFLTSTAE